MLTNSLPQPVSHPLLPFDTGTLLPAQELAFNDYISPRIDFFTPAVEITETFSNLDRKSVRVKDEKLFEKRDELLLDLSQISDEAFSFPLPNARVISPYGKRRSRGHTGIDLKTHANDTIRAAFDGIVRLSTRMKGYGNLVVIRHYNGLETVYSHNAKQFVKSGDRVTAGMPLGLVGRTGRATTEHVHFEVRINGQHFDPNLIIDFETQKLHNRCIVFTPNGKDSIRIDQV